MIRQTMKYIFYFYNKKKKKKINNDEGNIKHGMIKTDKIKDIPFFFLKTKQKRTKKSFEKIKDNFNDFNMIVFLM